MLAKYLVCIKNDAQKLWGSYFFIITYLSNKKNIKKK